MTNRIPTFEPSEVEHQAVVWYWQLQDPDLSLSEWHRWLEWHAIHAHREAFQTVAADWERWRRRPWLSNVVAKSKRQPRRCMPWMRVLRWSASAESRIAPAPNTGPKIADRGAELAGSAELVDQETSVHVLERVRLMSAKAAYWYFLCVDDPGMLHSERRELLAWMRRSPENIRELFKIAQLDGRLRRLKQTMRSLELMRSDAVDFTTSEVMIKRAFSFKVRAFAAALFLAVGLALVAREYMEPEQVVATGASQWHHMALPDGTVVHVDARSRVEVQYTDDARIVHVHEGSAVFDVVKDPKRPFIARTHLVDATAVGTRFGVSIDPGVTTTVSEGIVRVTARGRTDGKAVMLKAGEELGVSDSLLTSPRFAHVDAERKLEWTNGLLMLGGMTVAEGVEQLNRRNRVQIVVDTPALGARVVEFASVKVDSPESYAEIVAAEPGIRMVVDRENGVIRLSE